MGFEIAFGLSFDTAIDCTGFASPSRLYNWQVSTSIILLRNGLHSISIHIIPFHEVDQLPAYTILQSTYLPAALMCKEWHAAWSVGLKRGAGIVCLPQSASGSVIETTCLRIT